MAVVVPSFIQKFNRAEKHFYELQAEYGRFASSHPYKVATTVHGKRNRKTRAFLFTRSPENTDMPIIAADLVYNLRSGLDHLAACLASKDRDSIGFPIFWKGVWEEGVPGENKEIAKDRARWQTYTRNMAAPAVAIIKSLQPELDTLPTDNTVNTLLLLNRLSNTDRHSQFPLWSAGIRNLYLGHTMPDGTRGSGIAASTFTADFALEHGAPISDIPNAAVEVECTGTPVVMLGFRDPDTNVEIPTGLAQSINAVRTRVMDPLIPYLRVSKAAAQRAVRTH